MASNKIQEMGDYRRQTLLSWLQGQKQETGKAERNHQMIKITATMSCDDCGNILPDRTFDPNDVNDILWWSNYRGWETIGDKHYCRGCKAKNRRLAKQKGLV
jgi:hypothetical protein